MDQLYLGVDLGGTKIATVLTDRTGVVRQRDSRPSSAAAGVAAVVDQIGQSIKAVMTGADWQHLQGMGIASPGPIDRARGQVVQAPNLQWTAVPLVALLQKEFPYPCLLENDATAAAYGEKCFGAGRQVSNLIYLTVSTGIGGGIIIDGRIYRGRDNGAGEFGHMILDPDGPRCSCGRQGCLEALASGTAIAAAASAALANGAGGSLAELSQSAAQPISAELVARAAATGDQVAGAILERAFYYLGLGVANLVQIFNPELVVIGGGVARIGPPFFTAISQTVAQYTYPHFSKDLPLVPAQLGYESGALGVAALAMAEPS